MYLDKKDRILSWLTPSRAIVLGALLLVVLFAPMWGRTVQARFVMEPIRRETVRTAVPGNVVAVYVREGDHVTPGQPLLRMQNFGLESELSAAGKNLALAEGKQITAELNYDNVGDATEQSRQYAAEKATTAQKVDRLTVAAPIQGIVVSEGIRNLRGTHLEAGSPVAEIADTSSMRVRMFVPEFEVNEVRTNHQVRLLLDSRYKPIDTTVSTVLPASTDLAPGLEPARSYKGLANTKYYVAESYLTNDGSLRDQMSGTFKILVGRQSIAGMTGRGVWDFVGRKVW